MASQYNGVPFENGSTPKNGASGRRYFAGVGDEHTSDGPWSPLNSGLAGPHQKLGASHEPDKVPKKLMAPVPFPSWVEQLIRQVVGAKTGFSYFILQTIHASRSGRDDYTATALFPIPIPCIEVFGLGPSLQSQKKRRTTAFCKMLHLAVMALNYEHFKKPMTILQLIRRRPSALHRAVYDRLWMFLKACGPLDEVSVSGCGRKSFQLSARFSELEKALDTLGLNPCSLYHTGEAGGHVPEDNDADELRPFRPLDASRILLHGKGAWDCREYLSDLLYMPFVEPRINTYDVMPPAGSYPEAASVDCDEVLKLCKIWDINGLLCLLPVEMGPGAGEGHLHTRVFGNFKNSKVDRQIGDRRGRNFVEGKIAHGPSHDIPNATALLQLEVERFNEVLVGAVTDRRDFYHQFSTTFERASTNTVAPVFALSDFVGCGAYHQFCNSFGKKAAKKTREEEGDFLGLPKSILLDVKDDTQVLGAFASLFQGDHLGVEIACCAHEALLEEADCHPSQNRLCPAGPILHNKPVSGLVIDDFFVVSAEDRKLATAGKFESPNLAAAFLDKAKAAYGDEGILGSDDKEVRNALKFKVIGAEINSETNLVDRGLVSVGAPSEKRLGLSMLSAMAANLAYTSDALHASLVGSGISVLLYRRPMMAHMNRLFGVIPPDELDTGQSKLRPLPRKAAEELLILACLSPIAASNLAAPFSTVVYASDASTLKGGFVSTEVPLDVARILWRSASKKAKNPVFPSRTAALHRLHDEWFEEEEDKREEALLEEDVKRPLGLHFDFIEICGGAGVVTKALEDLGVSCGPIFDLSYSLQYDITNKRVFEWLAFMCEEGRLRSFMAAPPCTTFSPAAHPALRSYKKPLGFCRRHPRVLHGNALAFSSMGLMMVARRTRVCGMLETTRTSKIRWTPQWKRLRAAGADEVHLASCSYGSQHQKEFALLTVWMMAQSLAKKCTRDHSHIRIQGQFTKASATYCPGLARAIANVFAQHLRCRAIEEQELDLRAEGLEDALSNDVLLGSDWKVEDSWRWKGSSHINLLEIASVLRSYEHEAKGGGDSRFTNFVDSNVGLCALTRGRSSSDAMKHMLKRASTLAVSYGLYPAGRFAPTRLNPADHPTRDTEIPPAVRNVFHGCLPVHLRWIASLRGLRRWASNWVRLALLLCPSWIFFFSDHSSSRRHGKIPFMNPNLRLDFDATLGFPGEGPSSLSLKWFCFVLTLASLGGAVGKSHGDLQRRQMRDGVELPEGRRVTSTTASVRTQLMSSFLRWLHDVGLSFDEIFLANPPDLDKINGVLCRYGRFLFAEGKPYYHLSETINSVSAKRPILQAWDLCAIWTSLEPCEHHQAMPVQVLMAVLATCLVWGWTREAALFAMSWGMLLRIGEAINARRSDVIFPQDVGYSIDHVLLKILEPKTRFRAARHQSSKLEPPDLIAVVWLGIGHLKPHEKLWQGSSSTLRSRLDKVLSRLGLPIRSASNKKGLTLASFRPGGASYLISLTESGEMVRRRGRWISLKVMEVYLQEVASSTFMTDISTEAKQKVLQAMGHFADVLQMSIRLSEAMFPERTWNFFFQQEPRGVAATVQMGGNGGIRSTRGRPTVTQQRNAG